MQSVIDELITSVQNMQKLQPNKSATEIQPDLMAWVNANQMIVYNPFLMMRGMKATLVVSYFESLTLVSFAIHIFMWHRTPQLKSCIRYCLGSKIHLAWITHKLVRFPEEDICSSSSSDKCFWPFH